MFSSAIGAATNGSKVCDINADDVAWLSHLVGINLNNSQPAAELPIETTAERLSRLYHTSEQVMKVGAAKITQKSKWSDSQGCFIFYILSVVQRKLKIRDSKIRVKAPYLTVS